MPFTKVTIADEVKRMKKESLVFRFWYWYFGLVNKIESLLKKGDRK